MSHVDEGTLHAYLDGELAPVERERVDTHLKGCPACQARLAEERTLIERANRLLGLAAPPERAMPPLQDLRPARHIWRLRRPLAWAATLILAVGLGWYARSYQYRRVAQIRASDSQPAAYMMAERLPTTPPAVAGDDRLDQKDTASVRRERDAGRGMARGAAPAPNNTLAMRPAPLPTPPHDSARYDSLAQLARTAPAVAGNASGISIRGARLPTARAAPEAQAPEPQAKAAAPAVVMGEASSGVIVLDGAMKRARVILSSQWPIIARQPARDILGVEPVVIPGFAVRAYRRNPAAREIVVEQVTDAGTAISLIERRVETVNLTADSARASLYGGAAPSVNERLARFVGPLRVEIDGPLTPDSLSSLLELAR